jgi:hypothetical protein
VYVPVEGAVLDIAGGSAIVGTPDNESGFVLVDHQDSGGDVAREEFRRFIDRVRYAAGRHLDRYPTSARRLVPTSQLAPVGTYDERDRVIYVDGPQAKAELARWLGVSELDVNELAA